MSQIAVGVFKQVRAGRQTGLGTPLTASSTSAAQLRRTKSTLDLAKASYKSAEILVSQQRRDYRHGVRSVAGTISQEISPGCAQPFAESICRQVVQSSENTGAITTVTSAVTTAPAGTFTRSAGSFLTDGFNIGDVVQWTGWATTGAVNNAVNFVIVNLTATVMTVYPLNGSSPVGAKAAGDSVTCTVQGKKTWIPQSGQVRHYYTIEHWFSDIAQDEYFTDCVVSKMSVKLPASGMATVDWDIMGLNMTEGTAQYFTAATAQETNGIEASANGICVLNGVVVGVITSATIDMNGNYSAPGGIVGSVTDPDIFPGSIDITGTFAILFQDSTIKDLFVNETEFLTILSLQNSSAGNAGFTSWVMPRCKLLTATKDDNEKGLTLTANYVALEQTAGATSGNIWLPTSISIQDSAFA